MKLSVLLKHRREFLISLLCFFTLNTNSQVITNLVNNYSFEQYTTCPYGLGGVRAGFANYWFAPTMTGTSDYYHSCASATNNCSVPSNFYGNQIARTGNAYVGGVFHFYTFEIREDIECGLKQNLSNGKIYCVTFYVSLAEISRYSISNFGAYFSNDSVKNYWPAVPPSNYFFTPHIENSSSTYLTDTLNWMRVQGTYTANGTERFILIGNLRSDANTNTLQTKPLNPIPNQNTSYYYIDDVSVVEINPSTTNLKDTVFICPTNTLVLGTDSTWDATYSWQEAGAGSSLSCTNCPNPVASPTVTTKYYLTKQQCSATTVDSVLIIVITPTTQANAGNTNTICMGSQTQLGSNDSLNFTSYSWLPNFSLSCVTCAMPFANPNVTTTYTVQRTECSTATNDTVTVFVDDCNPTFTVPNVFTPNFDEVNDTWGIIFSSAKYIKEFSLQIYDRWGLLVYTTNSQLSTPNSRWDGRTTSGEPCSNGVYFFIATFIKNEEHFNLKGFIHLIR